MVFFLPLIRIFDVITILMHIETNFTKQNFGMKKFLEHTK